MILPTDHNSLFMISIDGSFCEGGGQIVRNALALSTITGRAFEITDIRKGRNKPGLKAQHVHAVKALKELCNAKVKGDSEGSLYLSYNPSVIKGKDLNVSIGTAGSITLLLQALVLPCLYSDKTMFITLRGGTDVKWAMPFDYFKEVYLPYLNMYGSVKIHAVKRGYYPKGGGELTLEIVPYGKSEFRNRVPPFDVTDRGEMITIKGFVNSSSELEVKSVGHRIAESAFNVLKDNGYKASIDVQYSRTMSAGCGIVLWAQFKNDSSWPVITGADKLGERGVSSEEIGKKAARKLLERIRCNAPVDEHLADNLIILLALTGGKIKVEKISNHTRSAIYVAEKFLGKIFDVNVEENIVSVKSEG
ncbi:MAG: RNA 3'-terminal phosphate cyclase [Candidatus Eremiobacterota bacterium]